jgi:hypothetical protein
VDRTISAIGVDKLSPSESNVERGSLRKSFKSYLRRDPPDTVALSIHAVMLKLPLNSKRVDDILKAAKSPELSVMLSHWP